MDFPKKCSNNRVLREWGESGRVQRAEAVGIVAVFSAHLAALDDQLGREGIAIFPVNLNVGRHFAENGISDTDALYAFQKEWVGQMLLDKCDDAVVTFDQVGSDKIPVIITIQVDFSQNKIGAVV